MMHQELRFDSSTHSYAFVPPPPDTDRCVHIEGYRKCWSWWPLGWHLVEESCDFVLSGGNWYRVGEDGNYRRPHENLAFFLDSQLELQRLDEASEADTVYMDDENPDLDPYAVLQKQMNEVTRYSVYVGDCHDGVLDVKIAGRGFVVETELPANVLNTFGDDNVWKTVVQKLKSYERSLDATASQIPPEFTEDLHIVPPHS